MPTALPRWASLLVLPMLVGALLLMHGLDVHASDAGAPPALAATGLVEDDHSHAPSHSRSDSAPAEHSHCLDCLAGHVMVACVAILTAVAGARVARRVLARASSSVPDATLLVRARRLAELARPPDPPWVRLSVMRC